MMILKNSENPPSEQTWIRPVIHPCQRQLSDIPDTERGSDYIDMLNTVQRHTRCSTAYCLRKKHNSTDLTCRFNFPLELCQQTELKFEEVISRDNNVHYKANILTKRNDARLNNHQQIMLQNWRANCDIQVVIDHYACLEYLAKYAAKGEPRSPLLKQVFNSIVQSADQNSDPHKAIKKVIMKTLGERDYAAQETMHHLLSSKLHSSSFNVVPVSLNGSRRLLTSSLEAATSCTSSSPLDNYANRDQYSNSQQTMNLNFLQFATKYKVVNRKLTELPENSIPRIFPTYSSNPKGPNFALYCKYQLLRIKPWKHTLNDAWGGQDPTDDVFIAQWQEFLQTPYAQDNVPQWFDKLQAVIQCQGEPDSNLDDEERVTREEWMVISDLHTPFVDSNPAGPNVDWLEDRVHYSDQEISEMPSWIKSRKQECNANMQQEYDFVDTSTFSDMQDLAYNIIKNNAEDNSDEKEPLFFIVIGVAGTGKSYLINAIRYLLQRKCMVTATTGKAAFNIRGVTIHSLLKLPVGQKGNRDLTCQSLHRLQESLNGVDYIIIDEYSMLGQVGFGWIDRCCKQATGVFSQVLGGKSLILTGDPGQLPPVADKPLYHAFPSNAIGEQ